mmetsp:Transcript_17568/g.36697  ORF Transcript_17568/g.36697 Transcript_17568/m.36697 type:complete len:133 (+) Transcript_17568:87-485(+)
MAKPVPRTFVQDMPRKGGFPSVRYKQIVPRRGPPGIVIVGGAIAVTLYGLYNHVERKHEDRFNKLGDFSGRYERGFLIQAREKVDADRLKAKLVDQERQIMANVPGWVAGKNTYYTQPNKPRVVLRGNIGGN